jgi:hypothetical protein
MAKGFSLLVHPSGAKYWRLKYRYDGKEKLLSLEVSPDFLWPKLGGTVKKHESC